jgi:hypothetical protein
MKYFYILVIFLMKYIIHYGKKITKSIFSRQYIRHIDNHNTFSQYDKEKFLKENEFYRNKRVISISPGGYKGIYLLGTCMYMKENFNLDEFIFSGASAGAWNSLVMCYKKDASFIKKEVVDYSLKHAKTIIELESMMKDRIVKLCDPSDFDLNRLFIGVTTMYNYKANTTIFYGFTNLEDAANCCIASSHIPLVSGGILNKYRDMYTFDGGFSKHPYLNITTSILHLTPNIWINKKPNDNIIKDLSEYTTLFSKSNFDFTELYESGYQHAHNNHAFLKYVLDCENYE